MKPNPKEMSQARLSINLPHRCLFGVKTLTKHVGHLVILRRFS